MARKTRNRHAFRFSIEQGDGKHKIIESWAKVKLGSKQVLLDLKAEHVKESIRRKGVGNTQTCSMAICASRQRERFSHHVEGFIDWTYSRAYVVSKLDKSGLPCECFVYSHSDEIAKLNDTKGGQEKLLDRLTRNGDRSITLRPVKDTIGQVRDHHPKKLTGRRASPVHHLKGAKARFAVAQLGVLATG